MAWSPVWDSTASRGEDTALTQLRNSTAVSERQGGAEAGECLSLLTLNCSTPARKQLCYGLTANRKGVLRPNLTNQFSLPFPCLGMERSVTPFFRQWDFIASKLFCRFS